MLPFLKQKRQDAGVSMVYRAPDAPESSDNDSEGLEAAARDLHSAIQSGDIKKLAAAIKAAFEICESAPSAEPSTEEQE